MDAAEQARCDRVRELFTALSAGDLERLRAMLDADATWEVMRAVPGERFTAGRDAIIDDFLTPVRGRFLAGGPTVTVDTVLCAGRLVAAETRAEGTMLDGSEYSNRYAWMIELDGDLVTAVREYMDTAYARASHRP